MIIQLYLLWPSIINFFLFSCLINWNISADNLLNKIENDPDAATQMLWKISDSPAGRQTARGVRFTAKLALEAGTL